MAAVMSMRQQHCAWAFLFATAVLAFTAQTQLSAMDLVEVVKKAERSTVRIDTDRGFGSGVIVDERGWIITNFHVIEGIKSAKVRFRGGDGKEGESQEVVGCMVHAPACDLAVLKVNKVPPGSAQRLAADLPQVGEKVAAFGSPNGFTFTTSEGIVSAIRTGQELREIVGREVYVELGFDLSATWIQTTAALSGGNSGGPLLNMNAELVGLNTWAHVGQSLNFAIALPDIKQILARADGAPVLDLTTIRSRRRGTERLKQNDISLRFPSGHVFSYEIFRVDGKDRPPAFLDFVNDDNVVIIQHANRSTFAIAQQSGGKLNGLTLAQHETGEKMLYGTYSEGKRHGLMKTWNEIGDPVLYAQYHKGRRHGFLCFHEDKRLRLLIEYKFDTPVRIQLMSNFEVLEGFDTRAEAEKNKEAKELLSKLAALEKSLLVNETTFKKQVLAAEEDRRRMLAAQLAPQKRRNATQRANERSAADAEYIRGVLRSYGVRY
jgi:hypothetical protein